MALFGKKTEKKEVAKTKTVVPVKTRGALIVDASSIIIRPHITEKAGIQSEGDNRVYTFQVYKDATKHSVSKAVRFLYKVTPVKVRVINLPAKKVLVRGKIGTQSAVKKAMVYLKKGDKIEFA